MANEKQIEMSKVGLLLPMLTSPMLTSPFMHPTQASIRHAAIAAEVKAAKQKLKK